MVGSIRDIEVNSDSDEEDDDDDDDDYVQGSVSTPAHQPVAKGKGMFSMFRGLVGSKALTIEDMAPVLEKLKDHLISKNVAADISAKLCDSVAVKLQGKVSCKKVTSRKIFLRTLVIHIVLLQILGTFDRIASTVEATLNESLVQILSPRRRVDILRDAMEAKKQKRPYVMTFCGVNGVGKSTNLAKVNFFTNVLNK